MTAREVLERQEVPYEERDPGTWNYLYQYQEPKVIGASLTCPKCGEHGIIGDERRVQGGNHIIKEDGTVEPSVECPLRPAGGCSWHTFIRLEGWDPDAAEEARETDDDD